MVLSYPGDKNQVYFYVKLKQNVMFNVSALAVQIFMIQFN